jgi:hypothetical protein
MAPAQHAKGLPPRAARAARAAPVLADAKSNARRAWKMLAQVRHGHGAFLHELVGPETPLEA